MISYSIIVPTFNNVDNLRNVINSLLAINYEKYEIVVVNDGSTDGTGKYLNSIEDEHLKIITQNNTGVSSARNNGMRHARGDYILFVDDDDELDVAALSRLSAIIEKNDMPEIVRYSGFALEHDGTKKRINRIEEKVINSGNNAVIDKLLFNPAHKIDCYVWLVAIKRACGIIPFNEKMRYMEDEMFYVENFRAPYRKIIISDECLYIYKYNPKSKTKDVGRVYENFSDLMVSKAELQLINKDNKQICAMIIANVFRILFARYNNARKNVDHVEAKRMRKILLDEMRNNSIKLNRYYPVSLVVKYIALKVGVGV